MNLKSIRLISIVAAFLMSFAATLPAAEASKEDAAVVLKLITAIENSDYDTFVADGEAPFKQLKKEQFDSVAVMVAPKLKAGHTVSYLGELKQQGYRVTLWKVSFKDGGDDALATLSVKGGKVGGFYIQ